MGITVVYMDSTGYAAAVAAKVEKAIDDAGETQVSISEKTGIPRTTLQRRLNSSGVHPFNMRELADIATALGVPAAELAAPYMTPKGRAAA